MSTEAAESLTEQELEEARVAPALAGVLAETRGKLAELEAEHSDLQLLYEATIAHGEAVEDQLAESNILLQRTQARLEEELNDASRYACSILPEPRSEWPSTEWYFEPSTELGGDSFGYHHIDPDHFAIYLIDVCGHGIGAALLSATIINVLRTQAMSSADFRDPSSVLAALNDTFPMENQNNMFFTIWYGVHDRRSGELRYSSGGHPAAILLSVDRDDSGDSGAVSTRLLGNKGNVAIGTFPGLQFPEATTTLHTHDQLLVYSDGAYEIPVADDQMLSQQDLVDFASADAGRGPAEIYEWVQSQYGEGALPDDFSVVKVHF